MKRLLLFVTLVCAIWFVACDKYDDSKIWDSITNLDNKVNNHENRIKALEELCAQMNTNISALQTIVTALEKGDFITNVAPVNKDGKVIGYTITFSKSGTITIYHGEDGENGADGTDGTDGEDGHTPIIGVKKASDGIYYWTVDGQWLFDADGNKIKAVGTDGKDGADGEDGKDGEDGEDGAPGVDGEDGTNGIDGQDGITPQLKIEDDYWYVSYDEGKTWIELGKATGNGSLGAAGATGPQGPQGEKGEKGDSFFQSVTQDNDNVYFVLADGTTITVPKSDGAECIELTYIPRYSDGKATVFYTTKADSYVELDFEVSPASAAANWRNNASVKAVYTQTRAGVEFVDMEILAWSVDSSKGTITVKASCENLSDDFFAGEQEASARLSIALNGGKFTSEYIPMVATYGEGNNNGSNLPPKNEIWYTSTDGNIVTPYATDVFGANIVSNTYENGKGVIVFDEVITLIPSNAFNSCSRLVSLTIPNGVTEIGYEAFHGCSSLTGVTIPDSVKKIGALMFFKCSNLQSITIPDSVTEIGNRIAEYCSSLTAFYGKFASEDNRCLIVDGVLNSFAPAGLTSYTIPNNVVEIGVCAFYRKSNIYDITIPNSVTTIGDCAFYGCTSLTNITIPDSVTKIDGSAFSKCSSLTNITIPNSVTEIGHFAFESCSNLTNITIPDSVTEIGDVAFYNCTSLTNITIPNSVTTIGGWAFEDCISLSSITIPNSVTVIGTGAFVRCENLVNIYCKPTTPPTAILEDYVWVWNAFDGISTSAKIYVPAGSVNAYKSAEGWSEYADAIVADSASSSDAEGSASLALIAAISDGTARIQNNYTNGHRGFKAVNGIYQGAKLSWGALTKAASYDVYYKASTEAAWTKKENVTTNAYTFETGTLTERKYDFKVVALDASNAEVASEETSADIYTLKGVEENIRFEAVDNGDGTWKLFTYGIGGENYSFQKFEFDIYEKGSATPLFVTITKDIAGTAKAWAGNRGASSYNEISNSDYDNTIEDDNIVRDDNTIEFFKGFTAGTTYEVKVRYTGYPQIFDAAADATDFHKHPEWHYYSSILLEMQTVPEFTVEFMVPAD